MRKQPEASREVLWEKLGYKPHSKSQEEAHYAEERFLVPTCGRRWGKTTFAGTELTAYMMTPDTRYWICGPSYKLGEKEFRVVHTQLRDLGIIGKCKVSYSPLQGNMRIQTPWYSVLEVVSAESQDSLIGEGLDGVIMSEAARHKRSTWEQHIEPALTDKRGWAIFPSTPQGYNWYYEIHQRALIPGEDFKSWRFPSWTNPIVYPAGREDPEIQRIERNVSEMYFAQEYGAEFTTFVGKIYSEFDPNLHVKEIEYNPLWKNFLVFDYGYVDPFVCLDIMVDPSDNVYVWREYMVSYISTFEHGLAIKNRPSPEGYHIDAMFGDPRGADEAATLALVLGKVVGDDVPWKQGVEGIKRHLKLQLDGYPKLYFDPSCHNTIRQIQNLRPPDQREGHNAKEGQLDYDDHGADALRYFFNHYFVLGYGVGLSAIYTPLVPGGPTFGRYGNPFTRDIKLVPYG